MSSRMPRNSTILHLTLIQVNCAHCLLYSIKFVLILLLLKLNVLDLPRFQFGYSFMTVEIGIPMRACSIFSLITSRFFFDQFLLVIKQRWPFNLQSLAGKLEGLFIKLPLNFNEIFKLT